MDELLSALRSFDALRDAHGAEASDVVTTRTLSAQEPEFAPTGTMETVPAFLRSSLVTMGRPAPIASP
jgi:hypothetical protein